MLIKYEQSQERMREMDGGRGAYVMFCHGFVIFIQKYCTRQSVAVSFRKLHSHAVS